MWSLAGSDRTVRNVVRPQLSQFSVVSWDVDGTLYSLAAMATTVTWLTIKGVLSFDIRRIASDWRTLHQFRHQMDRVRSKGGTMPKNSHVSWQTRISIEKRWYGEAIRRVGLREGVRDAQSKIRDSGLLQIVVSDYHCSYKLEALGLENAFDHVYAGEELGYLKPSPALFGAVADELHVDPHQILHIGDRRERDGIAASGAGCSVLILGENFRSFPGLIKSLRI